MASVRAAEGDTGAPRAGGSAASDAFTKREASEELRYIKEQERTKLLSLKKKLAEQRKHLEELDKHIDELTKSQGGEHN
ncbi:putative atpase mitochondrial [Phaeomoniella chlamydospora]|uniref:ATPase inhibitor, mitochondrial n=1 Tax=Phaeomoniella chlamydospora TaxID=158046 RepID=A0A0G2GPM0_PHACM|nr:putative atpase mitochondrial [Phaeomoniella chlamydospora]